jgi:Retroviral aspartyl protease
VFSYGRLQSSTRLGPEVEIEVSLPFGVPNPRTYISEAIVDSGAAITCIPLRCLTRLKPLVYGRKKFRGAFGEPEYKRTCYVDIKVDIHEFNGIEVAELDNHYALIGRDILNQKKILLDAPNRQWQIL